MNCKHGITSESCAICNGTMLKKENVQKQYRNEKLKRKEYTKQHKHLQELSILFAKSYNKDVTDEDIKYILVNTKDVEKEEIEIFFNIAKKLERTLYAIEWVYKYAWNENIIEFIKNADDNKWYLRIQSIKERLGL